MFSEFFDTFLNYLGKFLPFPLFLLMISLGINFLRRIIDDDFYISSSIGTYEDNNFLRNGKNNFLCNGNCKGCDMNKEHCVIKANDKFCQHCLYNDYSLFDNCKKCKYSNYNENYRKFVNEQNSNLES